MERLSDSAMPSAALMGSIEAASALAERCRERGVSLSATKLQKMLYVAYGVLLAGRDELLCPEFPRAWTSGPVFLNVYLWTHDRGRLPERLHGRVPEHAAEAMDAAIAACGHASAQSLCDALSAEGTPCAMTLDGGDGGAPMHGRWGSFIPNAWTKAWFARRLRRPDEENEAESPAP